ncbi:MAG: molybdate ABC transporter permease subunit [Nitrospira sp.]|nr:molybdate ABC transporter permease subunit [Nitrospira sp.]MCB9712039.1 molybdate ABC transporter permease subunit [Nitrospiraceae bacterium]HQU28846.1 molybdate ABC transporter permease subunit [Nitrospirales bacterium]MCA9466679.1 molybdate ABC transporter permease subunit [Nitrospira sp.]MCA9476352.1 molybdate ABC transporter permease subunit [Nitrospira sp.]
MPNLDLAPLWLTLQLATVTVIVLLIVGTPLAWWLAFTSSRIRTAVEAIVAIPIVLPPTVLGFYLLIVLGPHGFIGGPWKELSGSALSFTFTGLVIASTLYSLPFVVQPLHGAFESLGKTHLEAAWALGASKLDAFFTVAVPMTLRGFLTAIVLGFAHTLGEFGVVLMVGGNIPGQTKVLSIAIYDHVEVLEYSQAHTLSAGLLTFSFLVLLTVYTINRRLPIRVS